MIDTFRPAKKELARIREGAKQEPSEVCPECEKEGGWVLMKHLKGRYHVRCAMVADFKRQAAERGQLATDIPFKIRLKFDRIARRMTRQFRRE